MARSNAKEQQREHETAPQRPRTAARRRGLAGRALSCALSALLVVTMNPIANDLGAYAAPIANISEGGGSFNDLSDPQVAEGANGSEGAPAQEGEASQPQVDAPAPQPEADAETDAPADPAAEAPAQPQAAAPAPDAQAAAPEAEAAPDADAPAADESDEPAPYATWADVAAAVESGELADEAFKPAGSGTSEDPYVIATPEAFAWWAAEKAGQAGTFARLDADIDLTSRADADDAAPLPWPGDATLAAQLDGKGHAVLFDTQGAGLFAEVAETGAARWLVLGRTPAQLAAAPDAALARTSVRAQGERAGSLAGANKGAIQGIVNLMEVSAAVSPEDASPQDAQRIASQEAIAGGIVGENDGTLRDCANLGAVSNASSAAASAAAGLAAAGSGTVETSYNAGSVKAAQNAACIAAPRASEADYAAAVDEATCYLAPGDASYEGIPEAVQSRPGSVSADELRSAAERLNDGREGEAAVWSSPDAQDGPTASYPAPSAPENPDAAPNQEAPEATTFAAPRAAAVYASWTEVGEAVDNGLVGSKPSGDGSAGSPFFIGTAEQLAWFQYKVQTDPTTYEGKNAKLTADIDLAGLGYTGASDMGGDTFDNCLEWEHIGTLGGECAGYAGTFDGQGFGVKNMRVAEWSNGTGEFAGLFGLVTAPAVIKNVNVLSGFVPRAGVSAGGVIGETLGLVTVQGCSNAATVSVDAPAGGIVGVVASSGLKVIQCSNSGSIRSSRRVAGGLVSGAFGGKTPLSIEDSYNVGEVSSSLKAGGLVGVLEKGSVKNCYNAGKVTGDSSGSFAASVDSESTVENCYYVDSIGSATNEWDSKATGVSQRDMQYRDGVDLLNGTRTDGPWWFLPGVNNLMPVVTNSQPITSWSVVGARMEAGVEGMPGKPVEKSVTFSDGSSGLAYEVSTPEQLAWLAFKMNTDPNTDLDSYRYKSVLLTADIDLSGLSYTNHVADGVGEQYENCLAWYPFSKDSGFGGKFDGGGHVVKNMRSDVGGLIGWVSKGTVQDVGIVSSYAYEASLAALVSGADAVIQRCFVASDVAVSGDMVGGLLKNLGDGCTVKDCWSRAAVEGISGTGGLAFTVDEVTLSNCYSAPTSIKGPVGYTGLFSCVVNMYRLPNTSQCFYQKTDGYVGVGSVMDDSDPFTPKTEAELRTPLIAGLMNDTRTGADAPWTWNPFKNDAYPELGVPPMPKDLTWETIGAMQTEEKLRRTEVTVTDGFGTAGAEQAAAPSGGSYLPALSGSGTAADPYVISTPEALAWFACKVNDSTLAAANQNARLGASVDLAGFAYTGKTDVGGDTFANCLEWIPIGNGDIKSSNRYQGSFDGQGKTIANLRSTATNASEFRGLFGSVEGGTLSAITLSGGYVSTATGAGGLVGVHASNEVIEDCVVNVSVHGTNDFVGGVVGAAWPSAVTIKRCANLGSVSADGITGAAGILGGAAGDKTVVIEDCYNMGAIASTDLNAAGMFGRDKRGIGSKTLTIKNCYNAGSISGSTFSNSIAYVNDSKITLSNCFYDKAKCADASVQAGQTPLASDQLASWGAAYALGGGDGTMDKNPTTLTTWRAASGPDDNGGYPVLVALGAPLDDAHLQPASDWGDVGLWVDAFATDKKPAGKGDATSFYQIGTPEALAWFACKVNDGTLAAANQNAKLTAGIDLAGTVYTGATVTAGSYDACLDWKPMGGADSGKTYQGTFDGDGKEISNLFVNLPSTSKVGLVGTAGDGAVVQNAGIASGSLTAAGFLGGFVGCIDDDSLVKVSDCRNAASVVRVGTGPGAAGGIVGGSDRAGSSKEHVEIARCYNTGSISSKTDSAGVGGIAGYVPGSSTVRDCYNRGSVGGGEHAGGVLGGGGVSNATADSPYSTVSNCYNTGTVTPGKNSSSSIAAWKATVTNCYALPGTVENTTGITGAPVVKSTAQLQAPMMAYLLNAGRTGGDIAWTWDASKNDKYPILGSAALSIASWGEVGQAQDEAELRRTKVNEDADGFGAMGAVQAAAPSGGSYMPALSGSGTEDDPYILSTPEAFAWWGNQVNANPAGKTHNAAGSETAVAFNASYAGLGANLDLGGLAYQGKKPDEPGDKFANCLAWVPVGGLSNSNELEAVFSGGFDGQGHGLANMRVQERWYRSGLFGYVNQSTIKDVHVLSGYVHGTDRIGGIVGEVYGGVTVEGCSNAATIVSDTTVGGAGSTACNTGGIVGCLLGGTNLVIRRCSNSGDVSSTREAGGILGLSNAGSATIEDSYNTGSVSRDGMAVSNERSAGGIAGGNANVVLKNCYNAGRVTGVSSGALVPNNKAVVTNCYFANDVGSTDAISKGVGVTSDQLRSWGAAYALGGGDGERSLNEMTTWRMASGADDNGGFPVLVARGATGDDAHLQPASNWGDVGMWVDEFAPAKKPAGDGTTANPFSLTTPEAFAWWGYMVNHHNGDRTLGSSGAETSTAYGSSHAHVSAALDLAGAAYTGASSLGTNHANCLAWSPIGDSKTSEAGDDVAFTGSFNGGGYAINNLRLVGGANSSLGLLGLCKDGAVVQRVMLASGTMDITDVPEYGRVGANMGRGGTVVSEALGITVNDCASLVDVVGTAKVLYGIAGIAGWVNGSTLKSCYYGGTITAGSHVSGAIGPFNGELPTTSNLLYVGEVSTDRFTTGVTSEQLQSWGAAYQLNGGEDGVADLNTWRQAKDEGENKGYPVLLTDDEIADGGCMTAASTWADVGAWVDTFATDKKPAESSGAYNISTPEQLAWFAYKVNADNGGFGAKNAVLTAPIDLFGTAFTGKKFDAGADLNAQLESSALPWVPICNAAINSKISYSGTFNGKLLAVSHMYTPSDGAASGLFGCLSGKATGVAVEASYVLGGEVGAVAGALISSALVERCSVGADVTVHGSVHAGGVVGNGGNDPYSPSTIANCYCRATVTGSGGKSPAGIVGFEYDGSVKNCYFAGKATEGLIGERDNQGNHSGNYLLKGSFTQNFSSDVTTTLTSDQLASWGTAYQLNGGDEKSLDEMTTWRKAANADENNGYPVLLTDDEIASGGHMTAASNWGDVGLWVDTFATDKKPAESSGAYSITAPEQLAWFAYKVNSDNAGFGAKNAELAAPIDLFGTAFTGKTLDAGADLNTQLEGSALAWVPICNTAYNSRIAYSGTFNGKLLAVSHMYTPSDGAASGLFGCLSGKATGVAVEASYVLGGDVGAVAGALVSSARVERCSVGADVTVHGSRYIGGVVGNGGDDPYSPSTIANCYCRATVTGSGGKSPAGIVGFEYDGSVKNCYFAGKATEALIGKRNNQGNHSNNYILKGSSTQNSDNDVTTTLASDQLASWGAAYALNGGDEKSLDEMTAWRKAANADENNGYPVLLTDDEIADGSRMTAASNWADVGAWVDAFATDKKPAGDGSAADPYQIGSPEAFAWLAYKVNANELADDRQNAQLAADVDLAGAAYTGNAAPGEDFSGCLAWSPIGYDDVSDGSVSKFEGRFDGRGHAVENLLLSASGKTPGGLFGNTGASSAIVRTGIASGAMKEAQLANMWGTLVGLSRGEMSDCYSRADIIAKDEDYRFPTGGSLVGSVQGGAVERCYYAGSNALKACVGKVEGGTVGPDVYFVGDAADDANATAIAADQLASWGAAYQLNGAASKLTDMTTWRQAANADENDGYPVLVAAGTTGDASHLQPASEWGDVGAWVDAFAPDRKPKDADGAESGPYVVTTPEQLAWFAYRVNNDNGAFSGANAVLAADLDLSGTAYTGLDASTVAFEDCLTWSPIGKHSYGSGSSAYNGHFDGAGKRLDNLHIVGDTTKTWSVGLFGYIGSGSLVERIGAASGLVDYAGASYVGSLVGLSQSGTVRNCYSLLELSGKGSGSCGGLVGQIEYGSMESLYVAGTHRDNLSGVNPVLGYCTMDIPKRTYYVDGTQNDFYNGMDTQPFSGVHKISREDLKSWMTAYQLNDNSYVGKTGSGGNAVASTVWTIDDRDNPTNDGYPVFGDLTVTEKGFSLDAGAALESDDGTVTAKLEGASLTGKVVLLEALDTSGLTGASLVPADDVKSGFASWGTDSANAKLSLAAGDTDLTAGMAAGAVLSESGLSQMSLNLAAAYNSASEREVSFVAVSPDGATRIGVKVPAVTSKTLDVTLPVEGDNASFELSPDGTAHTLGGGAGQEAALAAAPSVFQNNGKVPVAGTVSKVEPLEVAEGSGVTAKLSHGTAELDDAAESVTGDGNTRLGITSAIDGAPGGNTTAPVFATPLLAEGKGGGIPLYFALQGSLEASDPNALAWRYFLEYTGTYHLAGGAFGYATSFEVYLPKSDVAKPASVFDAKVASGQVAAAPADEEA